jgi:hypothetical protein
MVDSLLANGLRARVAPLPEPAMELENYDDISSYGASPGFRFQFYCPSCTKTWKSPFKPYRKGQVAGFFGNLMSNFHIGNRAGVAARLASDTGLASAKQAALAEALKTAETMYSVCSKCNAAACGDCFNPRRGLCPTCSGAVDNPGGSPQSAAGSAAPSAAPAMSCPNCRAAHAGGRFCAECGFDMASTHKSCPDCGAMALRQARYCNDCGHGF